MRARLKTRTVQVWQHDWQMFPVWVSRCVEIRNDGLYLVRSSGKQLIRPGEWLVHNPDGQPLWLTDAGFHAEYELTPGG
jgi:hypothetical protein